MSENKGVCMESLKKKRKEYEDKRMLIGNFFQSLGAITEKALSPMHEELEENLKLYKNVNLLQQCKR